MEKRHYSLLSLTNTLSLRSVEIAASKVVTFLRTAAPLSTNKSECRSQLERPSDCPNIPDDAYICRSATAAPKTIPNKVFVFPGELPSAPRKMQMRMHSAYEHTGRRPDWTFEAFSLFSRRRMQKVHTSKRPPRLRQSLFFTQLLGSGEKCRRRRYCSGSAQSLRIFKRLRGQRNSRGTLNLGAFHVSGRGDVWSASSWRGELEIIHQRRSIPAVSRSTGVELTQHFTRRVLALQPATNDFAWNSVIYFPVCQLSPVGKSRGRISSHLYINSL